jgi:hypothetical protein
MAQEEDRLDLCATLRLGPLRALVELQGERDPEMLTEGEFARRLGPLVEAEPDTDEEEDLGVALRCTREGWPRPDSPLFYELTIQGARVRRMDLEATLELATCTVEGECMSRLPALEECLRLLVWLQLTGAATAGLLVHSACAVRDGVAWCFPAYGGTGKSTLIALTPGDLALSDELALLTRDAGGGWRAWPSPFWNWGRQLPAQALAGRSFPLGGVGFLSPATETLYAPIRAGEALTRLMEQAVAFESFPVRSGRTFELAAELVEAMSARQRLGMLYLRKGDDPYHPLASKSA